jgi:hypothetical protein
LCKRSETIWQSWIYQRISGFTRTSILGVSGNDKLPTPPTTEVLEGELDMEYEIEKLMGYKKVRNGNQYLVKWKGYPHWESTWVTRRELLRNAHDLFHEYERECAWGQAEQKSWEHVLVQI